MVNRKSRKEKLTAAIVKGAKAEAVAYEISDTVRPSLVLRVNPRSAKNPHGHRSYYVLYRHKVDGVSTRFHIGGADLLTPGQAREKAKEILARVALGEDPASEKRRAKAHSLQIFLEGVYNEQKLKEQRSGKATLARMLVSFKPLLGKELDKLSEHDFMQWKKKRVEKDKVKRSTILRDLNSLQAALNWAVRKRIIAKNPLSDIDRVKSDSEVIVRCLSDDEAERLVKALDWREAIMCEERASHNEWLRERSHPEKPSLRKAAFSDYLKPMVLTALNTGLRRGELFGLTWDAVNLEMKTLTVTAQTAKSGRTRHVRLNSLVLDILKGWKKQAGSKGLVFESPLGGRFDNINKAWRNLLQDAEITGFRFHDCRHTFASRLVQNGADLYRVQKLLGHASLNMTEKYSHLRPEDLQEAVDRLVKPSVNLVPSQSNEATV